MSGLLKLFAQIATPPPPPTREYDGLEYRWKMFTFRPAAFKVEAVILLVVASYLAWYLIGRYINTARAKTALQPYKPLLDKQFSVNKEMVSSGPGLHLLYSTGRRNMLCMHTTLTLTPIHDVVALGMHFGKAIIEPTYDASETLIFNITLGRGEAGLQGEAFGVWAIVAKNAMRETREKRWDLTFPRLHESASLPGSHALYTEHSDVTDALFKTSNVGISEVLTNPKAADILKYLLITDQPARRPAKGALASKFRSREIVLAVYKPSNSAQVEIVKAWLQVILNIADLMSKPGVIKPEVTRKLAKNRAQTDIDLSASYAKEKAEDEPSKEQTAEERRFAKKQAERAKMSEKELKKADELEKKREMRKLQKRQAATGMGMGM